MMSKAELMGSYSYRSLELYLDAGIIYVLLCFILHGITGLVSGRNRLLSDNAAEFRLNLGRNSKEGGYGGQCS